MCGQYSLLPCPNLAERNVDDTKNVAGGYGVMLPQLIGSKTKPASPGSPAQKERRQNAVSASLLIRLHERSGLRVGELRELLGDRRNQLRVSPFSFLPPCKQAQFMSRDGMARHG